MLLKTLAFRNEPLAVQAGLARRVNAVTSHKRGYVA